MQDSKKETEFIDQTKNVWSSFYDKISNWINSFIDSLPNLIIAIVVFILFLLAAKYIGRLATRIFKRHKTELSLQLVMVKIIKVVIVLVGFFVMLGILNLDTVLTTILAGAGVVGLAVGLALQTSLNNTFSGVIISFIKNIKIGDWIRTHNHAGHVIEVNLRSVVIKTAANTHVMVPNSKIVESVFENLSSTKRGRITIKSRVSFDSDLDQAEKLVKKVLADNFKQSGNEEIEFFYTEFGTSSIQFITRFWTNIVNQKDIYTAQHKAIVLIKKALDKENINIPYPIRSLDFNKSNFPKETLKIEQMDSKQKN